MAKKPTIHVCGKGKHCCKRDGDEVKKALKKEIASQGVDDLVCLENEGCMGLCSTGPTVIITPGGIQYGGVTVGDCAEIVRGTARGEPPIERLLASNVKKKKKKDKD